ncbi:MAG: hypothetical protein ACREP9_19560 [Candidatus Dormibacteraceae bacterium]
MYQPKTAGDEPVVQFNNPVQASILHDWNRLIPISFHVHLAVGAR